MENEIDHIGCGISSSAKETKELSNNFIFCVFIRFRDLSLAEHITLIESSKQIFLCYFSLFKFSKLFFYDL